MEADERLPGPLVGGIGSARTLHALDRLLRTPRAGEERAEIEMRCGRSGRQPHYFSQTRYCRAALARLLIGHTQAVQHLRIPRLGLHCLPQRINGAGKVAAPEGMNTNITKLHGHKSTSVVVGSGGRQ